MVFLLAAEDRRVSGAMRDLRTDRTAQVVISTPAFLQNLRRGHYALATETPRPLRVVAAFTELAHAI